MSRRDLAQDYWDVYEASLSPRPGSAAQNLDRIRRRVRAGELVDDAPAVADPPPRRAAAAGLVLLGKSASASVGIAAATLLSIKLAVVGWAQLGAPPPRSPVESSAAARDSSRPPPVDPPSARPSVAVERPVAPVQSPASSDGPIASPAPRDKPRTRPTPAAPADLLRAEVELMDRAAAALDRGDAEALWRMMDEHARRFPHGALGEERQAWRAVAACRLGHPDAAARATRFLQSHARSAQAAKVRRACDGLPIDRVTDGTPSAG